LDAADALGRPLLGGDAGETATLGKYFNLVDRLF
jgi:hypothetical protein